MEKNFRVFEAGPLGISISMRLPKESRLRDPVKRDSDNYNNRKKEQKNPKHFTEKIRPKL